MQAKLYHGTPAVNSGEGRTQLCELVGGGDSKGRFNPPTSRFIFWCQTLNYLKKKIDFPPNRVPVYLHPGSIYRILAGDLN